MYTEDAFILDQSNGNCINTGMLKQKDIGIKPDRTFKPQAYTNMVEELGRNLKMDIINKKT